jgi:UDP-N-acetylglucosamine:LPS N-acetylglucosamine transferase
LKTWGNLGNLLAARKLARRIDAMWPGASVTVLEGESFCPTLAEFGVRIRELKDRVADPLSLRSEYLALMAEALQRFPSDSEAPGAPMSDPDTARLADHFHASRPDIVVGAKGLLSRLCVTALGHASLDTPVVNHVTNHGLISLPVHRSRWFALNLVPFEETRSALVNTYGYSDAQVEVIGPIISGDGLRAVVAHEASDRGPGTGTVGGRAVIVFANHASFDYARLLEDCGDVLAPLDVIVIAHQHPALLERVRALKSRLGAVKWRTYDSLEQVAYLDEIAAAARFEHSFLVSKSGPNTVLEAVNAGLPVLVHLSGLPMEDWVAQFVATHGLGRACESDDELAHYLRSWLESPETVAECKRRLPPFAAENIDPGRTDRRLLDALTTVLQVHSH